MGVKGILVGEITVLATCGHPQAVNTYDPDPWRKYRLANASKRPCKECRRKAGKEKGIHNPDVVFRERVRKVAKGTASDKTLKAVKGALLESFPAGAVVMARLGEDGTWTGWLEITFRQYIHGEGFRSIERLQLALVARYLVDRWGQPPPETKAAETDLDSPVPPLPSMACDHKGLENGQGYYCEECCPHK
jgi:hypothetical protein